MLLDPRSEIDGNPRDIAIFVHFNLADADQRESSRPFH
jgi:hypothetical protein